MPIVSNIIDIINKIANPSLAEEWDNPGMQVGSHTADVTRIMVALDPLPTVIDAAISASCQLLVTHHPLMFKPLRSVSTSTVQGRSIHAAIRGGLSIVSMHTNYDSASGGLNDLLAEKIGLSGCRPLRITSTTELSKLVTFVPDDHCEQVRNALFPLCESIGNYSGCSFSAGGDGTFTPREGAAPFSGTIGVPQRVSEQRLEVLVTRANLPRAVKALLAAHPYEEPAYDLYPLLNEGRTLGLGRVGHLPESLTLREYSARIRELLDAPLLRYVGDPDSAISKVALCSGSGASLLREGVKAGADVLVTGDVKYHEALDAEDAGICLIDAGHFPTEIIMVDEVSRRLTESLDKARFRGCQVVPYRLQRDPFRM